MSDVQFAICLRKFKSVNELKQYLVENYSEELRQHCIFLLQRMRMVNY